MRLLFWGGTLLAALLASTLALLLLLPLGLIVVEYVAFPLALGVAALLAALAASWMANVLARDQTRTEILRVVVGVELLAAAVAALFLSEAGREAILGPLAYVAGICALALAAGATVATARWRTTLREKRADIRLTWGLLLLVAVSVPLVLAVAALLGLTGA
jgi:hypothetical protein